MPQPPRSDPWIAYRKPRPRARMRLFCFPYAGGGALFFRQWPSEAPEEIEVLPVQLPGREQRLREKPYRRMDPLVDALVQALDRYLDLPFAIFGHSMGSVIGYEVAQRLWRDRGLAPVLLAVSARRAPQLPPRRHGDYKLPDPELCERLRQMNGTPPEVLEHPELMQIVLPLIRADFELNETYSPEPRPPLDCPLTAYGGVEDPEVPKRDLEAWSQATSGPFELRMFPGDHFYVHQGRGALIRSLAEDLLRQLP